VTGSDESGFSDGS